MQRGYTDEHRWGVILAGGEGARLRSLTRLVSGDDTPKQFCSLLRSQTLLAETRQRIGRSISLERTIFSLLSSHERYYSKELGNVPRSHLIPQPCNRGTLPAILSSLVRIVRQDKNALIGFFPSDHHYADEGKFLSGLELAFDAAGANPDSVLLLGAPAKHAEAEYGWIEAEPSISTRACGGFLRVKRFWEKPSMGLAQNLLERGCVWNTFVMVGHAGAFLEMAQSGAPDVYREFEGLLSIDESDGALGTGALRAIYERLPMADFSKAVLSAAPERLGVYCLGDVGWSDLGDPRRVIAMLSETGVKNDWMTLWDERSAAVAAGH